MEMIVGNRKIKGQQFSKLLRGYGLFLKSILVKVDYRKFDLPVKIWVALLILSALGITRTVLSLAFGLRFLGGLWFTWDLGLFFVMAVFPIFLTFFPAMIIDYAFRLWKIKISSANLLGFFFFAQIVHLGIPFLDFIHATLQYPYYYALPNDLYFKLAVSPLAATPIILLVTMSTSGGITPAWAITIVALLQYGWRQRIPMIKYLSVLMLTFYLIYVVTYPTFLLFYIYDHNFYWGMTFLVAALGGILYFKARGIP